MIATVSLGPGYSVRKQRNGLWTATAWDGRGRMVLVDNSSSREQALRQAEHELALLTAKGATA